MRSSRFWFFFLFIVTCSDILGCSNIIYYYTKSDARKSSSTRVPLHQGRTVRDLPQDHLGEGCFLFRCARSSTGRGREPGAASLQGFSRAHTRNICRRAAVIVTEKPHIRSSLRRVHARARPHLVFCYNCYYLSRDWLWPNDVYNNNMWLASARGDRTAYLLLLFFIIRTRAVCERRFCAYEV